MENYTRNPNTTCDQCQTPIYKRPWELERYETKFCSQKCYGLYNRQTFPCPVCGKEITAGENKKTCSRSCANKNRSGIKYGTGARKDKYKHSRNAKRWLIEERGAKCEVCGYAHSEALHAHHIMRTKEGGENTLENLILVCPNCHYEIHHKLPTPAFTLDTDKRRMLGLV